MDFRSDTVTRPCAGMRQAMATAEVGDDVFGDDPTVNRLQDEVAERFGMEAALFVPSGTMANQVSIRLLTSPGDEILCGASSHLFLNEGGGLGLISGVQPRVFHGEGDQLDLAEVRSLVRKTDVHHPRTKVLALEQTHNFCGGTFTPRAQMQEAVAFTREAGIALFVDGARIWNAAVASGESLPALVEGATLATACFSKGLGAPAGSVVLGSRARIEEARRIRKALGGGMRQVGVLAAAARYALQHRLPSLHEDHRRARRLAEGLAELPDWEVEPERVVTNLVFARRENSDAEPCVQRLERDGLRAYAIDDRTVRFVTHHEVEDCAVERALDVLRDHSTSRRTTAASPRASAAPSPRT